MAGGLKPAGARRDASKTPTREPASAPANPDEPPNLASMTMAEQLAWNATQLGKKPKRVIGAKPESAMTLEE